MSDRNTNKEALKGRTCERRLAGGFRVRLCGKPAKVLDGGKAFCGVHDPERKRKRDAAFDEEWNAKRALWAERDRKRANDERKIACHDQLVAALETLAAWETRTRPELTWGDVLDAAGAALAAAKVPQ